jgi:hypothetical protein
MLGDPIVKFYLALAFALLSANCFAGGVAPNYIYSGDSYRKMYAEMQFLYQLGIELRQKYDYSDKSQVKICKDMDGFNLTRARNLIGLINRIGGEHRDELVAAGWDAYECARCGAQKNTCEKLPAHLERVKQLALEQMKNKP